MTLPEHCNEKYCQRVSAEQFPVSHRIDKLWKAILEDALLLQVQVWWDFPVCVNTVVSAALFQIREVNQPSAGNTRLLT